jgi:hypothetical protein
VIGYGLDDRGRFSTRAKDFCLITVSRTALGLAQPPIHLVPELLPWGKKPPYQLDRRPPLDLVLGEMNPIHIHRPSFFKIHFTPFLFILKNERRLVRLPCCLCVCVSLCTAPYFFSYFEK